jgi:DNA-binding MarR family transcriptional regulator
MQRTKIINTLTEAINLNLETAYLRVMVYLHTAEKAPIKVIAAKLSTCHNNLGAVLQKMADNGILEFHPETALGDNHHILKQYCLAPLGKNTMKTILKHKLPSLKPLLGILIRAYDAGTNLPTLRVMIYLSQVNSTTAEKLAKRLKILESSATDRLKKIITLKLIQRLANKTRGQTIKPKTQFILSRDGEDATLKILNIKRPKKIA